MKNVSFLILLAVFITIEVKSQVGIESLFESELKKRNVEFVRQQEHLYKVHINSGDRTISLYNISRNFERDNDAGAVVRFVENQLKPISDLPGWNDMKKGIYPSLEPSDYNVLDDILHKKASDESAILLSYYNKDSNQIRWLHQSDLKELNIPSDIAWEHAVSNLDKIMENTEITYTEIEGEKLGMIEANEPYKASLIFSNTLKNKVIGDIGWPIYAVAPARDFVYLFSKGGDLINKVGNVVVREYKNSGYPISTEVWELSDKKQEPIGAFPTE